MLETSSAKAERISIGVAKTAGAVASALQNVRLWIMNASIDLELGFARN